MSLEAMRLVFGCSISFILGGVAGVMGLRTLYGDSDPVEPELTRRADCRPVPCVPKAAPGVLNQLPLDEVEGDEGRTDAPERPYDGDPPAFEPVDLGTGERALPGLPASAADQARGAVLLEVAVCEADVSGPGVALLALTVTATGGVGFVQDALMTSATGSARDARDCLVTAATRARFAWDGSDGQLLMKLPVSIGR